MQKTPLFWRRATGSHKVGQYSILSQYSVVPQGADLVKLVFIVLNTVELLEEIIEYMVEQGIRGGTVLDSVGMGRILAYDIPIFAGFRELMVGARANNRTMMTTIPDDTFDEFMEGLDKIVHFDEPGTGVAFAVDIYKTYGVK